MTLNSNQKWRLEKLIKEIVTETEKGYAVNHEKTINTIQEITENPETVPACPMCSWSGRQVSACPDVQMGNHECRNCYGDVVESLKSNLLEKDSSKKEKVKG